MLNEQTLNQLRALRLDGMVAALSDAATHITASELPFEQRLALLVQREVDWRDSKRLERLLKAARLKVSSACLEDIDWRASRGLSREVITSLAGGDWLRHGHNVLLTGATGCGKTWLACALGQQAARLGFSVAVHADCDIFLADEVLAVGDRPFKRKCLKKMEEIRDSGRTLFYVSHAAGSVRRMCNRVLVLQDGHLAFDGDVDEGIKFLHYDDESDEANEPDADEDDADEELGADI